MMEKLEETYYADTEESNLDQIKEVNQDLTLQLKQSHEKIESLERQIKDVVDDLNLRLKQSHEKIESLERQVIKFEEKERDLLEANQASEKLKEKICSLEDQVGKLEQREKDLIVAVQASERYREQLEHKIEISDTIDADTQTQINEVLENLSPKTLNASECLFFDDDEDGGDAHDGFKDRVCQTETKKRYPRRSIASWHSQRARNKMSVQDLVKTLEKS